MGVAEGDDFCKRGTLRNSQPRGVVAKHAGLWSRRQRFESARGYGLSPAGSTTYATELHSDWVVLRTERRANGAVVTWRGGFQRAGR
jgi:hypothetical protein